MPRKYKDFKQDRGGVFHSNIKSALYCRCCYRIKAAECPVCPQVTIFEPLHNTIKQPRHQTVLTLQWGNIPTAGLHSLYWGVVTLLQCPGPGLGSGVNTGIALAAWARTADNCLIICNTEKVELA